MRIEEILVKGLFGLFDHTIPLKTKDHITIIHGPNGLGKTVILTMLDSIFSSSYAVLRSIPFLEMQIVFDNKNTLSVKKLTKPADSAEEPSDKRQDLVLEFVGINGQIQKYVPKTLKREAFHIPVEALEELVPGLERIAPNLWAHVSAQEPLTLEEVVDRWGDRLRIGRSQKQEEPDWLKTLKEQLHVRFIQTQRLLRFQRPRRSREFVRELYTDGSMVPSVIMYSEELVNAIQAKLAEYASLSQSLDRTFPTRLVRGRGVQEKTMEQLRADLRELEEKRSRLMAAGLLDKEREIDFKEFQNIEEGNQNVLSVWVDDVKNKLGVFDELTNKIDLLVKIVNGRFLYKQMSISKKEGFVFRATNGKKVPSDKLSSGEQHELVLFYELLFKVKPNSLILIDEPELSLHVIWQQLFLRDLQEIAKLTGLDFLLATHSPSIIHDRWDLTVELRGPENA